jgi:hypothetical protein
MGWRVEGGRDPHPFFHGRASCKIDSDLVSHVVAILVLEVCEVKGASWFREYHLDDFAEFIYGEICLHGVGSIREERTENHSSTPMHSLF